MQSLTDHKTSYFHSLFSIPSFPVPRTDDTFSINTYTERNFLMQKTLMQSKIWKKIYPEKLDVGAVFQVIVQWWGHCGKPLVSKVNNRAKTFKCTVGLKQSIKACSNWSFDILVCTNTGKKKRQTQTHTHTHVCSYKYMYNFVLTNKWCIFIHTLYVHINE